MPIKLNYQIYGEGKPVIILHGLFGSSRNWTSIAKKLSANFRIINVDLRNHGDSDHADTMTYSEMTEDIYQLLNECGLEQASLIGHSMGGKVAMAFALNHQIATARVPAYSPLFRDDGRRPSIQAANPLHTSISLPPSSHRI